MPREFTPKVITANAVIEGDVVYLIRDDRWWRSLTEADMLIDEAIAQYRLLQAQARSTEIMGAYLADVHTDPDGPVPAHFREDFRRKGPSNRFHCKQADGLEKA